MGWPCDPCAHARSREVRGRAVCPLCQAAALNGPARGQRQAPLGPAALQPISDRPDLAHGACDAVRDVKGHRRGVHRVAAAGRDIDLPKHDGLPAAELSAACEGRAPARGASEKGRAATSQQRPPTHWWPASRPRSTLRAGPDTATAGESGRIGAVRVPQLSSSRSRSRAHAPTRTQQNTDIGDRLRAAGPVARGSTDARLDLLRGAG